MSKLTDQVKQAILPVLNKENTELVDIEFEKKFGQDNLTVFIYTPDGVTLDDCERIHLAIDPVIDELDPTNGQPYVLNVSSPGLDRAFKTQRDFERNYGNDVEVKLFAPLKGKKIYEGILVCREENATTIKISMRSNKNCDKGNKSDLDVKSNKIKNDGKVADNSDDEIQVKADIPVKYEELKIENNKIAIIRPLIRF